MSKPFVLLQTRPEDLAADNEYESFMKFSGLNPGQLLRHRVHEGALPYLDLDRLAGIFIGGGPYCITDPAGKKTPAQKKCEAALKDLLDEVIPKDFPLLAACYIGFIIEHQEGVVSRRYPEVIGGYEISLNKEGLIDPLLSGLPEKFLAFSGHKESCEKLPAESVILASSAACPVQLLRIKNNIYACQFHPELDNDGLKLRVQVYKNHGYYPADEADRLIAEATKREVSEPVKILRNFVETFRN